MENAYDINGATGEVIVRQITQDEQAVRNDLQVKMVAVSQAQAAAVAAKESAKAKLAALGLTDEEINAIIGGV